MKAKTLFRFAGYAITCNNDKSLIYGKECYVRHHRADKFVIFNHFDHVWGSEGYVWSVVEAPAMLPFKLNSLLRRAITAQVKELQLTLSKEDN